MCDIYDDLDAYDLNIKYEALSEENKKNIEQIKVLQTKLENETTKVAELEKLNGVLKTNISKLYLTCKAELAGNKKTIVGLRKQLDGFIFRRKSKVNYINNLHGGLNTNRLAEGNNENFNKASNDSVYSYPKNRYQYVHPSFRKNVREPLRNSFDTEQSVTPNELPEVTDQIQERKRKNVNSSNDTVSKRVRLESPTSTTDVQSSTELQESRLKNVNNRSSGSVTNRENNGLGSSDSHHHEEEKNKYSGEDSKSRSHSPFLEDRHRGDNSPRYRLFGQYNWRNLGHRSEIISRDETKREFTHRDEDKCEFIIRDENKSESFPRNDDKRFLHEEESKREITHRDDNKRNVTNRDDYRREFLHRDYNKREFTHRDEDKREYPPRFKDKREYSHRFLHEEESKREFRHRDEKRREFSHRDDHKHKLIHRDENKREFRHTDEKRRSSDSAERRNRHEHKSERSDRSCERRSRNDRTYRHRDKFYPIREMDVDLYSSKYVGDTKSGIADQHKKNFRASRRNSEDDLRKRLDLKEIRREEHEQRERERKYKSKSPIMVEDYLKNLETGTEKKCAPRISSSLNDNDLCKEDEGTGRRCQHTSPKRLADDSADIQLGSPRIVKGKSRNEERGTGRKHQSSSQSRLDDDPKLIQPEHVSEETSKHTATGLSRKKAIKLYLFGKIEDSPMSSNTSGEVIAVNKSTDEEKIEKITTVDETNASDDKLKLSEVGHTNTASVLLNNSNEIDLSNVQSKQSDGMVVKSAASSLSSRNVIKNKDLACHSNNLASKNKQRGVETGLSTESQNCSSASSENDINKILKSRNVISDVINNKREPSSSSYKKQIQSEVLENVRNESVVDKDVHKPKNVVKETINCNLTFKKSETLNDTTKEQKSDKEETSSNSSSKNTESEFSNIEKSESDVSESPFSVDVKCAEMIKGTSKISANLKNSEKLKQETKRNLPNDKKEVHENTRIELSESKAKRKVIKPVRVTDYNCSVMNLGAATVTEARKIKSNSKEPDKFSNMGFGHLSNDTKTVSSKYSRQKLKTDFSEKEKNVQILNESHATHDNLRVEENNDFQPIEKVKEIKEKTVEHLSPDNSDTPSKSSITIKKLNSEFSKIEKRTKLLKPSNITDGNLSIPVNSCVLVPTLTNFVDKPKDNNSDTKTKSECLEAAQKTTNDINNSDLNINEAIINSVRLNHSDLPKTTLDKAKPECLDSLTIIKDSKQTNTNLSNQIQKEVALKHNIPEIKEINNSELKIELKEKSLAKTICLENSPELRERSQTISECSKGLNIRKSKLTDNNSSETANNEKSNNLKFKTKVGDKVTVKGKPARLESPKETAKHRRNSSLKNKNASETVIGTKLDDLEVAIELKEKFNGKTKPECLDKSKRRRKSKLTDDFYNSDKVTINMDDKVLNNIEATTKLEEKSECVEGSKIIQIPNILESTNSSVKIQEKSTLNDIDSASHNLRKRSRAEVHQMVGKSSQLTEKSEFLHEEISKNIELINKTSDLKSYSNSSEDHHSEMIIKRITKINKNENISPNRSSVENSLNQSSYEGFILKETNILSTELITNLNDGKKVEVLDGSIQNFEPIDGSLARGDTPNGAAKENHSICDVNATLNIAVTIPVKTANESAEINTNLSPNSGKALSVFKNNRSVYSKEVINENTIRFKARRSRKKVL